MRSGGYSEVEGACHVPRLEPHMDKATLLAANSSWCQQSFLSPLHSHLIVSLLIVALGCWGVRSPWLRLTTNCRQVVWPRR